ncbi:MAG: ABC transporter ATP-binding protein/permease [Lachnospiraceae bacterium]|nr:ABC transporter ATP-binding protein/permease [Lachnospiraceae bacterium]
MQADKQNFLSCLLSYASGGKQKLILSVILSAVSITAGLVPYYCFYSVICLFMDGTAGMEGILQWSLLAFAAYAVKVLCFGLSTTASHYAAYHILEGLRNRVVERFLHAPLGEAAKHSIGEIKSIMVDKIEEIEPPLAHMVPEGSGHIVLPIVSMTALAVIDWRLFLASLITFPLSIVCMGLTFKISGKNYDKYNQSLAQMNSNIVEYVEGIEVIKAFGRTGESYGKFSSAILDYKTFVVKWLSSTWVTMKLAFALFPSTLLGVLPVALLLGADGAVTAAEAALAVMLSMSMVGSLAMLEVFVNELKKVQMTVEELQEYLEMPAMPEKGWNADFKGYDVELKDVQFSYEKEEVLHGISLKLPQGSFTALVGPSGSGKSTVARLISRFYDVADGSISIGGVDIRDMPLEQLTGIVSFVAQDNFLFRCSIKENIRMGNPDADDGQVFAAARAAQCEEFIKKLPDGYDTPAGEAGKRLSGGEKQRIAIARMMLKDSPVIILDEATAFTDPENEDKIQKSIRELTNGRGASRGKTLLVIAHRLSTIKNADNIVVLENGKILAQGKQEELLKTCPLYAGLWAAHIGAKNWSVGSGRTLSTEKEVQ